MAATYVPYTPAISRVAVRREPRTPTVPPETTSAVVNAINAGGNQIGLGDAARRLAAAPTTVVPTPPAAVVPVAPIALDPLQELQFAGEQINATTQLQRALAEGAFSTSLAEQSYGLGVGNAARDRADAERQAALSFVARGLGNSGFERRARQQRAIDYASVLGQLGLERTSNLGRIALDQQAAVGDANLALSYLEQARYAAYLQNALGIF